MTTADPTRPTRQVQWSDTFSVWPSLQVKIELFPWHWRLRVYKDDLEWFGYVQIGPVTLDWGWNKGVFPLERADDSDQEAR